MGLLLVMIHQCTTGGGALMAALPGAFSAEECQEMVRLLARNQVGPIFIAGGSPGGVVAHKHGWDTVPLTNVGDAALVFTPGGDYALVMYANQPETISYDDANRLLISMSRAVYNFYNK
jgi:beta-lactamase class A